MPEFGMVLSLTPNQIDFCRQAHSLLALVDRDNVICFAGWLIT